MAHQLALLRTAQIPARPVARQRPRWRDTPALCRTLRALVVRFLGEGYRPERHYMRGGRTEGCRSLAASRG